MSNPEQTVEVAAEQAPAVLTPISEYSPTAAAIATLRQKYRGVLYEVASTEGMQAAILARRELRTLRTALEAKRKEIKQPALERARLIDSEAQRITTALVELEDPIDAQIKTEEQRKEREKREREEAERARVQAIDDRIDAIRGMVVSAVTADAAGIAAMVAALSTTTIDVAEYGEFIEDAIRARTGVLTKLGEMYDAKAAQEAEAERQRQEAQRLSEQRAQQEREEAERRAAVEKEEAERRARIDREERDAKERRDAADKEAAAERKRIADEDAAERTRVAEIQRLIAGWRNHPVLMAGKTAAALSERIEWCKGHPIDANVFGEFVDEAITAYNTAVETMQKMRDDAVAAEQAARIGAAIRAWKDVPVGMLGHPSVDIANQIAAIEAGTWVGDFSAESAEAREAAVALLRTMLADAQQREEQVRVAAEQAAERRRQEAEAERQRAEQEAIDRQKKEAEEHAAAVAAAKLSSPEAALRAILAIIDEFVNAAGDLGYDEAIYRIGVVCEANLP